MGLLDIVRSAVKTADKVTKDLQSTVTYRRRTGQGFEGDPTFSAPVQLRAVVDWRQRQVRTQSGLLSVSRASVTFLDVSALLAATGGAGIDDNDEITLPDGTIGPILDIGGFVDRGTGVPVATEVFLG